MGKEHHIIYVPGLHDQLFLNKSLTNVIPYIWRLHGFATHIVYPHWEEGSFRPKLQKILKEIDDLYNLGHRVSLVGQSAGGSAVLNAFSERRDIISGVVNICGRMRAGENVKPTLNLAGRYSPAFIESVKLFEEINEPTLTDQDRRKIMTIRPLWDETVPKSTVPINGAKNTVLPSVEHSLSGILACTVYSGITLGLLKVK